MFLVLLLSLSLIPLATSAQPASQQCRQYTTQETAQADFDANPVKFRELDDDNDGIACEHLPSASNRDGSSSVLWITGGAFLVSAVAFAVLWRSKHRSHHPPATPDIPVNITSNYDLGVEIDLAAIKARQNTTPNTTTPGQET